MSGNETLNLAEISIPSRSYGRWIVLGLSALSLTGNYYAYDMPAALNGQLMEYLGSNYDHWQYQLALMYVVYSIPNIFLPFAMGPLIDKHGARKSFLALSGVVICGQLLFTVGLVMRMFPLVLMGRLILGVGGESLGIAQARITYHWFNAKELGFALGINLCFARLGSVFNDLVSPYIAERYGGVATASCFGLVMCVFSGICALLFILADYAGEARVKIKIRQRLVMSISGNKRFSGQFMGVPENGNIRSSYFSGFSDGSCRPCDRLEQQMKLSDLYRFPTEFWILCFVMICFYGSTIPLINVGSDFFQKKWLGRDPITAGALLAVPDLLSTLLLPFSGVLTNLVGCRMPIMILCAGTIGFVHWSFAFASWSPLPGLISLGCMSALYASFFWPAIALFVEEGYLATAYAVATSVLNTFLSVAPLIVAPLVIQNSQYVWVETFLGAVICAGLIGLLALWLVDSWWGGGILSRTMCSGNGLHDELDFTDTDDDYYEETEEVYGDSEANLENSRSSYDESRTTVGTWRREKAPLIRTAEFPIFYGAATH
ncbi:MFS general substrate transporter [Basidiobolus meristosporus CBS 931.73]|uniref:Lysosomal dipeptide transporter MFSD1 n=1 Tax=Basidiobolus meristosporus CBS 931.73 TaxID=1314790 RepID=A0A1Y1XE77_9FUNG|nr:MFS general substrate transporter [Basidiobolus meristosporus CBS 931.73]|eukprot:ORX83756.1 MFS general substrate transporter [Basidiobolus meristosporus CBS 931.73]